MSDVATTMNIDLEALKAEVNNIPEEDLRKQLLDIRTRQRVQQKKSHNPERQKAYQKKRNAAISAMAERAKLLPPDPNGYSEQGVTFANLYEQIRAEANAKADVVLGEQEAETTAAE